MGTLTSITISLLMITLFSIALVTYAINFGSDNNTFVRLGNDKVYSNFSSTNNVQEFYVASNISAEAFQSSTVSSQTEASEGGTQFKATPASSLKMAASALLVAYEKIFGSEFGIFFTAIISMIGLLIFFYAWKAWRGQP